MKLIAILSALSVLCSPLAAIAAPPAGHPPIEGAGAQKPADIPLTQKGKVLSVIDAKQYIYIEVEQDKKPPLWLAASTMALKKGDLIRFDDGMVMTNFQSKTLNRTFPSITFVNRVSIATGKE